jgi:hypothetical protein
LPYLQGGISRTRARRLDDWISQIPPWVFEQGHQSPVDGPQSWSVLDRGRYSGTDYLPNTPRGQQITVDENHRQEIDVYHLGGDFHGDIGGEFSMTRKGVFCDANSQTLTMVAQSPAVKNTYVYNGPVLATNPQPIQLPSNIGVSDLNALGTQAVRELKPTNNVANLAVDIFELKQEGAPKLLGANLWKERTQLARGAGKEYLNQEFGWKPLVSDIRDACYAAANYRKILDSYESHQHKLVRRTMEFPVKQSETWSVYNGAADAWIPSSAAGAQFINSALHRLGVVLKVRRDYERSWFSGSFTYHLPLGFNSHNALISAAAKAGPLLGIELTPETVWSAIPWSWAVNWVSNMGDCISNFSDMATDGLVMPYGYLMNHKVTSEEYVWTGDPGVHLRESFCTPSSITSYVETKKRIRATPFGFGLNFSSFTPRQLAITAALGLSRK